ncbi:MAG: hypothetical protein PHQ43_13920 [Dehalococcoidales bacterium]|nr:hypothetical protein [Dehalococcoidales bacterium]
MKKSTKPMTHFIKNSADRLAEADKILAMNPTDDYMVSYRRTESRILLLLALRYFFKLHINTVCKLFHKFNASNARIKEVSVDRNTAHKH